MEGGRMGQEKGGDPRRHASRYAGDKLPAARSRHAKESSPAACCLAFSEARATVRGMRPVAPAWQSPTRTCCGRPSKQVSTGTCVCCAVRPDVDVGAASKGLSKSCNASHTVSTNQVLNKGSVTFMIRVVSRSASTSMRFQCVWTC